MRRRMTSSRVVISDRLPQRELVLDRYRPLRPLGRGGSGSVWLARDERTGLDVALKIVPREGKRAPRAAREAEAAARLRHERCVRAYDFGGDDGHVYIAYEYVPGRTFRDALRNGAVSDRDAVEAAAQVLDGLAHAHARGIVHRDVKPSNVLLEDSEVVSVKLLDFGLAQFDEADTLTAVGDVPGTLAYIAPERLTGDEATTASDVWAVGVMLWEALVGRHPFWGVPLPQVAATIEAGAPPLRTERADLPRKLLAVVESALAIDPARRPRASELAASLRHALDAPRDAPRTARRARPAAVRLPRPRKLALPAKPVALEAKALSAGLAGLVTVAGGSLLPFWPPGVLALLTSRQRSRPGGFPVSDSRWRCSRRSFRSATRREEPRFSTPPSRSRFSRSAGAILVAASRSRPAPCWRRSAGWRWCRWPFSRHVAGCAAASTRHSRSLRPHSSRVCTVTRCRSWAGASATSA